MTGLQGMAELRGEGSQSTPAPTRFPGQSSHIVARPGEPVPEMWQKSSQGSQRTSPTLNKNSEPRTLTPLL